MKILNTSISRERLIFIALLFLMNIIMISARSVYFQTVPAWVYVLSGCVLALAVGFAVVDSRKLKGQKNSSERT